MQTGRKPDSDEFYGKARHRVEAMEWMDQGGYNLRP